MMQQIVGKKKIYMFLSFILALLLRKRHKRPINFYSIDCWIGIQFGHSSKRRKIYFFLKEAAWFLILWTISYSSLRISKSSANFLFKEFCTGSILLIDSSNMGADLKVILRFNSQFEDIISFEDIPDISR